MWSMILFNAAGGAMAQSSSENCGFVAANQYTVNSTCSFQAFNKPNSYVNNTNPGGCGSSANDDAFGWFIATATVTTVTYDPVNSHDAILHVLSGTCGSPAVVACSNAGGDGVNESVTIQTVIGTSYHFRVQRAGSNQAMDGSICVYNPVSNDIPCTAIALTVNGSCSSLSTTNVNSTAFAHSGVPAATCANWGGNDVWYTVTAPANGVVYLETNPNGMTNSGMELYSAASCGGAFTSIECDDDDGTGSMSAIYRTGLTGGQVYYVRVWGTGGGTGTFDICAWTPPPPSNDDPCGATSLTVGSNCTSVTATNVAATNSAGPPAPGCAAYSGRDVWFSFAAPASGIINIETSAGTLTDGGVAIYSATSCAGPFTLLTCDDNNGPGNMGHAQMTGLTSGVVYYARVWGNGGTMGTFDICAYALANDDPCGATSLAVGTSCVTTASTNAGATTTAGPPAPGCAAFTSGDVWFSFAAPASGSINIETSAGTLTDGGVAIYSAASCAGPFTLVSCDDNNGPGSMGQAQASGLTAGTTYYARVWGNGGATGSFSICAHALSNDNPCGATALTVGTSCASIASTNLNATTTTGPPAPGCAAFSSADVWFSFVAPSTGSIAIETSAGTLTDGGAALYSAASCNGPFTLLACDDNNGPGNMSLVLYNGLTAGTTYYVRAWGNGGATGTFGICAYSLANDNPCGATLLTVSGFCNGVISTNASATATTGPPAPGCAAFSGGDVWFRFVVPAGGIVNLNTSPGTLTDGGMALYSAASCSGPFTLIACDDNNGPGNMSYLSNAGLTVGATYYVRVWGNGGATGTFEMCAFIPLVNDNPCGATSLSVVGSCVGTAGANISATATAGPPAPGCANYTGGDVWYSFVAPASGNATIETAAGSMTDNGIALYSASSCAGPFTLIACDDNAGPGSMGELVRTGLTPGVTYYIRLWGNNGAVGSYTICVWDNIPPPNDEPCAAISIPLGTACNSTTYWNGSATNTGGIPDPNCGGYSAFARDVWFSFTAPSTGTVHFDMTVGTLANPSMALYSATACNGTYALVECDANDGIGNAPFLYFYDLIPGSTYYLRVWGSAGTTGTFNLCAVTPPTTGNCFYALHLNDTGGDGWGGSTVGVNINGGAVTNYTLSDGNRGMVYVPMNNGDIITITYTAVGGFQNEISYILQSGQGTLFTAGPTPASGTVYAHANDCVPPAAPREDCYGSQALCAATGNSSNPASTGLKPDLNIHTRGCLSDDERQGTWFNFTVSAAGTIEFTIEPSNTNDDYDFALWGPAGSVACPPTVTPYRCSYSGLTGTTGLSDSSTDVTEGSGGDKYVDAIDVTVGQVYVLYVSNWSQSGLQFDLNFNMINDASIDCTVLPVELLTFEANALDHTVKLDWATASEAGSSHFVVQRSANGEDFSSIGEVQGAGTSFVTIEYAFVDPQPLVGTNYYRLKQVDTDGSFSYSGVATANFGSAVVAGTPFPNPTDGTVNVVVNANVDGQAQLEVSDASGRTVHQEAQAIMRGTNTIGIDLQGLKPGTYLLTLRGADGTPTRCGRFVLR